MVMQLSFFWLAPNIYIDETVGFSENDHIWLLKYSSHTLARLYSNHFNYFDDYKNTPPPLTQQGKFIFYFAGAASVDGLSFVPPSSK